MSNKIWTKREIETHIKANVKDYGAAIVVSGLFKKLYGELPEIGLSGFQAGGADLLASKFPDNFKEIADEKDKGIPKKVSRSNKGQIVKPKGKGE